ncbi:MAG: hypothetical protein QG670_1614 [Thermoproteota archaeon]|nr:hypothetical protein [Thermoproteota archaeon]
MSDKENAEKSEKNEKAISRRKFIKSATIAGGAAVVGLSLGLPYVTNTISTPDSTPSTEALTLPASSLSSNYYSGYKPKTRKYYLYATDGIAWLPTQPDATERRAVYIYGFAKPTSDTRPLGSTETPSDPFADLNVTDLNTGNPIMRGKAQLPGPSIWGVEGDILEITLLNLGFLYRPDIMDAHTVHMHGIHAPAYYDGIPELSFGIPMWTGTTPANDTVARHSFTYRMYCERPGTYMYHCHVEASEHVQMGMYGPLWIYPKNFANVKTGGAAYNNSLTTFSQEVNVLLSEFDTRWHDQLLDLSNLIPGNEPTLDPSTVAPSTDPNIIAFNPVDYRPNFWLVNGRAFPDTVFSGKYTAGYQPGSSSLTDLVTYYPPVTVDGNTYNIPRQPVQTYVRTSVGQKILIRLTNMGFQYQPEHFHGVMPAVVGKDTFAWVPQQNSMFSTTTDQRRRIFTQGIFSGETYDMIAAYPDKAKISSSVYGPVLNNPQPNPFATWETYWGPTLDTIDPLGYTLPQVPTSEPSDDSTPVVTVPGLKSGYPLFYLWHVHDDYRVTNNGVYPGGAAILVRVDKTGALSTPSIPLNLIP